MIFVVGLTGGMKNIEATSSCLFYKGDDTMICSNIDSVVNI